MTEQPPSPLGVALAFVTPALVLALTWFVVAFFAMLGANGVMKNVDAFVTSYVLGSVALAIASTVGCGAGSVALARAGRMRLWLGVLTTTSLAVVVQCVGSCAVFMLAGAALDIF